MNDIDSIHKISAAKQLQGNEFLADTFRSIRMGLLEGMETVSMTDHEMQQAITLAFQVLKKIQDHIQSCIDDEKVHDFNLSLIKGSV